MKLFRIFAVGLILAAVVVSTAIAPMSSAVGPTSNPPNADVVPNFSGLNVSGDVDIQGNIKNTKSIGGGKTDPVTFNDVVRIIQSLIVETTLNVNGDATISGTLSTSGSIENPTTTPIGCGTCGWVGSWPFVHLECSDTCQIPNPVEIDDDVYISGHLRTNSLGTTTVRRAQTTMPAGQLINTVTANCNTGEIRVGCGGGFNAGLAAKLNYINPSYGWGQACVVAADNSAGGASTLSAYAICLNTNGT